MTFDINYYHTNWGTYARDFQVEDLPIDYMPSLTYAFFKVNSDGTVVSTDTYADYEKVFPSGARGNIMEFMRLKQGGKKFNLYLSVGGWTLSRTFSDAFSTATTRQTFVDSLARIFTKYPIFTGVNIDWEYVSDDGVNYGAPGNIARPSDAANCLALLRLLRIKLGVNYKIGMCVTADPTKIKFPVKDFSEVLDEMHIMTYDFADGAWGGPACHHTNLYGSPFSADRAVNTYLSKGASAGKLFIGVAFYSRGFSGCDGLGKSCTGGSLDSSWENGVCDYKTLPRPGAIEYWDDECKATYSYDSTKRVLNSYDSVQSVREKCKYVTEKGLGGIIVWESSGDVDVHNPRSLVKAMHNARNPTLEFVLGNFNVCLKRIA